MRTLLLVGCALLLMACASPSDLLDHGPAPAEPPQAVVVLKLGDPPADALATVYADLRGQFVLPVHFGQAPDAISSDQLPAMPELIRLLRANQTPTTVVVAVTDQLLPTVPGLSRSPRHGAVSIAQRVILVSTADLVFTRLGGGANLTSKMVLHMFGHVFGLAHSPAKNKGLMADWQDSTGRLSELADDYDGRSLAQLDRWLRSSQTPAVKPAAISE